MAAIPGFIRSVREAVLSASLGPLPGSLIVGLVGLFYLTLYGFIFFSSGKEGELAHGEMSMSRADQLFSELVLRSKSLFFRNSGWKTVSTFAGIAGAAQEPRPPRRRSSEPTAGRAIGAMVRGGTRSGRCTGSESPALMSR